MGVELKDEFTSRERERRRPCLLLNFMWSTLWQEKETWRAYEVLVGMWISRWCKSGIGGAPASSIDSELGDLCEGAVFVLPRTTVRSDRRPSSSWYR